MTVSVGAASAVTVLCRRVPTLSAISLAAVLQHAIFAMSSPPYMTARNAVMLSLTKGVLVRSKSCVDLYPVTLGCNIQIKEGCVQVAACCLSTTQLQITSCRLSVCNKDHMYGTQVLACNACQLYTLAYLYNLGRRLHNSCHRPLI